MTRRLLLLFASLVVPLLLPHKSNVAQACPLEIWAYESMEACVGRQDPDIRGTIEADGMCRQTAVLDNNASARRIRFLPGTYAAECRIDTENDNQHQVRFLHSGCVFGNCAISAARQPFAEICDQETDGNALSIYYARLAPPGWIPITDWSFTELGGRRCLGFTTDGNNILLAFSVIGSCDCEDNTEPVASPPPVSRPTLRPTRQPTTRPTRPPTEAPSPAPVTAMPVTNTPTSSPVNFPTTPRPTRRPTSMPTSRPTPRPTTLPTMYPTLFPTASPVTRQPISPGETYSPTTLKPTLIPTTAMPSSLTRQPSLPTTPKPTTSIALEEYTTAPQSSSSGNPDGVRGDNSLQQNDDNDDKSTAAVLLVISIVAGAGVAFCFLALVLTMLRRRRQRSKAASGGGMQEPYSPAGATALPSPLNPVSPPNDTSLLSREISIHRRDDAYYRNNEEMTISTLGDPAAGMMGQGYGEESTADPVRMFENSSHHDEEGSVVSIYTSGTDMRMSKDDTSLEDIYSTVQRQQQQQQAAAEGGVPGVNLAATGGLSEHEFHVEAPPGPLGILIHMYDGRLRVHRIKPESVFATTGVRPGDYLNAVDGVEVKFITPAALATLVQARSDASRLFTFERQDIVDGTTSNETQHDDQVIVDTDGNQDNQIHC